MSEPPIVESIPLDGLERTYFRTYDATGDAVGAHMVELDGVPHEVQLRAAVRDLQARHPRLRAVVVQRDHTLEWDIHSASRSPPLGVDVFDMCNGTPRWQDVVHRCMNEGLNLQRGPGMRVVVLRDLEHRQSRLFTVDHHVVSSGNLTPLHDLLRFYEAQQAPAGKRPPIESLPFVSLGHNCVAKAPRDLTRWDTIRARWLRTRRVALARQVPLPLIEGRREAPAWENHRFTPRQSVDIVRACRRHQVTTAAMLLASGLVNLRRILGREHMPSVIGCPFDVRHQFEGPQGPLTACDLGNFVTRMVHSYRVRAGTDLWQLAGRISKDTDRAIKRGLPRDSYGMSRFNPAQGPPHTPVLDTPEAMARSRPHLDIHQAGMAPFKPRYADLEVRACLQLARRVQSPSGFLLRIGAITLQNRLQVYLDPVEFLDPDFVSAFHTGLISTLLEIIEAG